MGLSCAMLIDAVLDEPDDEGYASTRHKATQALKHPVRDSVGSIRNASGIDHRASERLKEVSADRAPCQAGDSMTERSEAVLFRGVRGHMSTDGAGDDLNYEICSRPDHRDPFYSRLGNRTKL
jgi:hypothetical protein